MKITQSTDVTMDLKTIGIIVFFVIGLVTEYLHLKSEIEEAKQRPKIEVSDIEGRLDEVEKRVSILDAQTKKKR
jgi:Na+/glutamate symporter